VQAAEDHEEEPAPSLHITSVEEAPPSVVLAVEEEARRAQIQKPEPAPRALAVSSGPADLEKLRERGRALSVGQVEALLEEGKSRREQRAKRT
jgi:hypothetical protein